MPATHQCHGIFLRMTQILDRLTFHMVSTQESNAGIKPVSEILKNRRYAIGYFQREYEWKRSQIEQLINDLESKFSTEYNEGDNINRVKNYANYYMGSVITSKTDSKYSIIDGQQRLTTMTLFLIYLNNLQKTNTNTDDVSLDALIFSEDYGERTYNLDIEARGKCIDALYHQREYKGKGESEKNIISAYQDIKELFPFKHDYAGLPHFIWWLLRKVLFVEIGMIEDNDAYSIFETMNNRGLKLTYTEMLKGYLLSKKGDESERLNSVWKDNISKIKSDANNDAEFFTAWMRAKYAETVGTGHKSDKKEDFETVGTRFHVWIKDNEENMGLKDEDDFVDFVENKLVFYGKLYMKIRNATIKFNEKLEYVYYIKKLGVAPSFYYSMLMSSILIEDDEETINKKINMVARFLELFYVLKKINDESTNQNRIKQDIF